MDKGLLASATSSDDNPTPGYMLAEISRVTLSNYQASVQLQEYLLSRVAKHNHNIKYKCLVIIKYVCRTGRQEFKKEMARNLDPIKECLQYRGVPDPLRGDEPFRRVREAAREALDAIFDSQMPVTTSAVAAANRIQGMGNEYVPEEKSKPGMTSSLMNSVTSTIQSFRGDGTDAAYTGHPGATSSFNRPNDDHRSNGTYVGGGSGGAGSGPTQYSSSGMTGIGNPNYKDARDEKSWYQKAQEAAKAASIASFGNISNSMQKTTVALNQGSGEYTFANNRGLSVNSLESAYSPKQPMNAFGGPSWQPQNSSPSIGNSAGPGGVVPVFYEGSAGYGKAGSAASDGQYEKTMIDALCEPGGLKSVPPEDKLQSFMAVAPTLSAEVVGECLIEVLNSDAWQSRAKALIVISYLVKGKECDSHLEWWLDRTEELHSLTSDPKGTVRTQASKTLKALNADDGHSIVEQKTQSRKTVVPSATSTNVSLLDIDEVSTTAVELTVDTVETGSLFAGMSMGTVSSKSHSPAPSSPAPPSIPPQVLPSFDTLVPQEIVTSTPAVAPIASVSSPMSSSNAISDHFDFLDILNVPQETPIVSQNAVTSSLFGDLNVKSNVASGAPPPVPPMPPNNQQYTNDLSSLTLQPTMNQGSSVPIMAVKPMQYTAGSNNISNLSLDPKKQVSNHDPFQVLATGTGVGQQSAPVSIRPIPPTGVQQQGHPIGLANGQMGMQQPPYGNGMPMPYGAQQPIMAVRKNIPDSTDGSAFSFMGDASTGPSSNDSFSFVSDAMNTFKK